MVDRPPKPRDDSKQPLVGFRSNPEWEALMAETGVSTDPTGEPPHWSPAPINRPPGNGIAPICRMEEGTFVLTRVDDRLYAVSAVCPKHRAPMPLQPCPTQLIPHFGSSPHSPVPGSRA